MKNDLLVSVIMPAYNCECYVAEAISSILKQTYNNLELIIVNDASTDGTQLVIETFSDDRIKFFLNEKNMGVSASLNRAIDAANGRYIARMDADDVAYPKRIEKQVSFMEKHPLLGLCGTFAKQYNGKRVFYHLTEDIDIQVSLLFQNTFVHPSIMFRSEIIKTHKYSEKFNFCEDYELWNRLSKITQLANIPEILLNYRVYQDSVSFTKKNAMENLRREIVEKLLSDLQIRPTERELFLQMNFANVYDKTVELANDRLFLSDLTDWILRLIDQNRKLSIYNSDVFCGIMLFRLILACHFLNDCSSLYRKDVWKRMSFFSLSKLFRLIFQKFKVGILY